MNKKTEGAQSPSSFVNFHPHITLATVPSSTKVADLRAVIPSSQHPIPIRFKSLDVGNKYFMSVYVAVHHDAELVALREHLKGKLGEKTVPPLAHISLFYIDDSDIGERQKIADVLKEEGRAISHGGDSVILDCTSGDERGKDLFSGISGAEIWIALCDGPVPTWEIKDKIPL